MGLAQPPGNFHLRQPGVAARLHQTNEKPLVGSVVVPIVGIHTRMYIQSLTYSPN